MSPLEDLESEPNLDELTLTLYEAAQALQNGLLAHATDGAIAQNDFTKLRKRLLTDRRSKHLVPSFVRACRDPSQFWAYIKAKWPTYAERRKEIWDSFVPLLDALDESDARPVDDATTVVLAALDAEHVHEAWQKAIARRASDPEGAITSARTLLESVCMLILDKEGVAYPGDDLPKLYGKVARELRLAPSEHTEDAFIQILGRPTVMSAEKAAVARQMHESGQHTVAAIARTLGVSRATLYRILRQAAQG